MGKLKRRRASLAWDRASRAPRIGTNRQFVMFGNPCSETTAIN
jgi:hypothetical protein